LTKLKTGKFSVERELDTLIDRLEWQHLAGSQSARLRMIQSEQYQQLAILESNEKQLEAEQAAIKQSLGKAYAAIEVDGQGGEVLGLLSHCEELLKKLQELQEGAPQVSKAIEEATAKLSESRTCRIQLMATGPHSEEGIQALKALHGHHSHLCEKQALLYKEIEAFSGKPKPSSSLATEKDLDRLIAEVDRDFGTPIKAEVDQIKSQQANGRRLVF